jgi:hypothetical protein
MVPRDSAPGYVEIDPARGLNRNSIAEFKGYDRAIDTTVTPKQIKWRSKERIH